MKSYRLFLVLAGALATSIIAATSTLAHGPAFIAELAARAAAARDRAGGKGIAIDFATPQGWLTRHPTLSGGERLAPTVRAAAASGIAAVPGVGGAGWAASSLLRRAGGSGPAAAPRHCQDDVESIIQARSIRFREASAAIDPASEAILDEVAAALRPCVGSIIAVTGHTNAAGDEQANIALSMARARAVRWALVGRGIPADGLRAAGVGSREPLDRLEPADPANRRIEFSVIDSRPPRPTPVDTPGPGPGAG